MIADYYVCRHGRRQAVYALQSTCVDCLNEEVAVLRRQLKEAYAELDDLRIDSETCDGWCGAPTRNCTRC